MKVTANEVELCVRTWGEPADPAILLLAGGGSSMDYWAEEFCARLAAGPRYVVAYDYRDTGESVHYPPGEPGYTGLDLVADGFGVLDALGVGSAHLVGISMGGALAQLAALEFPDRVASLTLIATSSEGPGSADLPPPTPELSAYYRDLTPPDWADRDAVIEYLVGYERVLSGPEHFDEHAVRELAARVLDRNPDLSSADNFAHADSGASPVRPRLGRIAVPTLVIHGSLDPLFPLPHGEALAREIPDARLLRLDGVGHQAPPPSTWDTVIPAILRLTSGGWPLQANRLAALSIAAGDPTGWFDQLYAAASAGEVDMPWDRGEPNPLLVSWAAGRDGTGRSAVVVGCGLGLEAGYLASLGYDTLGFDIAETAVKLARERVSTVDFQVADLLALPPDWSFDLVAELYTVQAMPRSLRAAATRAVASLVAPGGTLLTVYAKDSDEPSEDGPPWPLTRAEVEAFAGAATGLELVRIEETTDRRLAEFHRPAAS